MPTEQSPLLRFDAFTFDPVRRLLFRDGEPIELRPKAIALLATLIENRDRVVTKEELLQRLWPDGRGTDANLTVTVAAVRRALGEEPKEHRFLITVPTVGYHFVAEVEAGPRTPPQAPDVETFDHAEFECIALLPLRWIDERFEEHRHRSAPVDPTGDGATLTRSIVAGITQLPRLDVKIVHDGSAPLDTARAIEIATSFDAQAVLEGTIRRTENDLRVELGLWDGDKGRRVWATRLVHDPNEQHVLPWRINRFLVQAMRPERWSRSVAASAARYTRHDEAFRCHVEGQRRFWRGDMLQGLLAALAYFERASQLDPGYALAYCGSAEVLLQLRGTGFVDDDGAALRVRDHAERALELDPLLPDAHRVAGTVSLLLDLDWSAAREHLLAALDFGPYDAGSYNRYAYYLASRGQVQAAIEHMRRAHELDPSSPRMLADVAMMHYYADDLGTALAVLDDVLGQEPSSTMAQTLQGWFRLGLGEIERGRQDLEKLAAILGDVPLTNAVVSAACAAAGDESAAATHEARLHAAARQGQPVPKIFLAMAPAARGDFETAARWMEQAHTEKSEYLPFLHADPFWRPLATSPEFAEVATSAFRRRV